jgi:hypothetical protein
MFQNCQETSEIPLNPPEAVKKFRGFGKWQAVPCPGDGKKFHAKRGTDFFFAHAALNLYRDRMKIIVYLPGSLEFADVPSRNQR